MKLFIYLFVFALGSFEATKTEESAGREKRQIYYKDIQSRPKSFRSRHEEKETDNSEEGTSVQTSALELAPLSGLTSKLAKPFDSPALTSSVFGFDSAKSQSLLRDPSNSLSIGPNHVHQQAFFKRPFVRPPVKKPSYDVHQKQIPAYEESYFPKAPGETYHKNTPKHKRTKNTIPGVAGKDYPVYTKVPHTSFSCSQIPFRPGMYANPEAGCQAYHVCHDDRHGPQGAAFLCTNGTVFNQETFSCDWWYNVDCDKATSLYQLNADPEYNPYYQKPYEGPKNVDSLHTHYSEPAPSLVSAPFGLGPTSQYFREAKPTRQVSRATQKPKSVVGFSTKGVVGRKREVSSSLHNPRGPAKPTTTALRRRASATRKTSLKNQHRRIGASGGAAQSRTHFSHPQVTTSKASKVQLDAPTKSSSSTSRSVFGKKGSRASVLNQPPSKAIVQKVPMKAALDFEWGKRTS